jgi:vacuolar iron transporter family protein
MALRQFNMDHSMKTGLSFGITSATITTLGLMTGLNAGTHSQIVVMGGILTIAVADAFSDALGIHVAEEAKNEYSTREVWEATIATFISKFVFGLSFILPFLFFPLGTAIDAAIAWGLALLIVFSVYISRSCRTNVWSVVTEHLVIAVLVLLLTNFFGGWIAANFIG